MKVITVDGTKSPNEVFTDILTSMGAAVLTKEDNEKFLATLKEGDNAAKEYAKLITEKTNEQNINQSI